MPTATTSIAAATAREIAEDCLAVRVRLLNRRISRIYDAALRPHGVSIAQLNLLVSIAEYAPVPAGRLADGLSMEISTLSRNVGRMAREGWVEALPAERGNGKILRLTPAGAEKLVELRPAWEEAQGEATALLGPETSGSIRRLVDDSIAAPVPEA
jgi:DNA-binding MarR family transcriptional regulator